MSSSNPTPETDPVRSMPREEAELAVLEALASEGRAVSARFGADRPEFRSRLCFVDPARQFIVVERGEDAAAEAALLASPRVSFHADWGDWHIEFESAEPQPVVHGGATAIRLRFPDAIVTHRRRASERVPVPSEHRPRCIAVVDEVVYFEAEVCDISTGGIGVLQFHPEITLDAGTVIRGCRIEREGRNPVQVDLEIRYTGPAVLPDGHPVKHAGCRFIESSGESGELRGLIAEFSSPKS